jgi:hypothetical protein
MVTLKIDRGLKALGTEWFTLDQAVAVSGLSRASVQRTLYKKHRSGLLERNESGAYRSTKTRLMRSLPSGIVANAVWICLATAPKAMRLGEIVAEVESFLGEQFPARSMYGSVAALLSIWHRLNYLVRTGKYHEYAYALREGVAEQPVSSRVSSPTAA